MKNLENQYLTIVFVCPVYYITETFYDNHPRLMSKKTSDFSTHYNSADLFITSVALMSNID